LNPCADSMVAVVPPDRLSRIEKAPGDGWQSHARQAFIRFTPVFVFFIPEEAGRGVPDLKEVAIGTEPDINASGVSITGDRPAVRLIEHDIGVERGIAQGSNDRLERFAAT